MVGHMTNPPSLQGKRRGLSQPSRSSTPISTRSRRPFVPQRFDPANGVYIIAEAGSNHFGNLNVALGLVSQAAKCGADAVKFQLFKLEDILKDPSQGERWWE